MFFIKFILEPRIILFYVGRNLMTSDIACATLFDTREIALKIQERLKLQFDCDVEIVKVEV